MLSYRENSLRFEFAAPIFDQKNPVVYEYRLDDVDQDWSTASPESFNEYTNLREGSYRFLVRARDSWGETSEEASFAFTIQPPFHRSVPAFLLYALAGCGIGLLALRGHRRTLARERSINERLREVDRLKDEFLAKTSHELRTPLYGITGLAESLIDGAAGEVSEDLGENLSVIVASGRRLGHLVDDILDFSKLRHGGLSLASAGCAASSSAPALTMRSGSTAKRARMSGCFTPPTRHGRAVVAASTGAASSTSRASLSPALP